MTRQVFAGTLLATLLLIPACEQPIAYYSIRDPATGHVYYAESTFSRNLQNGAIHFKDGKTGAMVTLQNSEVSHIAPGDYYENISHRTPETPAPTPQPTPSSNTP